MNHIFAPLQNKYLGYFENYMHDCSIMTGEGEDDLHCQIITEFLQVLRENHLFLQPTKCLFKKDEINFLGMCLNHHRITIDPGKLAGIHNWPHTLGNVKEVRKILGVLGYQWPFIPNFASFARPLTNLLKKDATFEWTPNCCQALDTLINIVTSSLVLVAPDQDHQYELEVDASQFAIGAILWQRDPANAKKLHAIGYYSATLSPTERNYKVFDRELLGIIHALHHWSHLLRGTPVPVIIWTNHCNLTYWCEPHKVGPHTVTWQIEL